MSISVSIQDGVISQEKLKASKSVDQINLGDIKSRLYSLSSLITADAIDSYIKKNVSINRDKTNGTILVEINSDMVKRHLGTDKIRFDNESQLKEFLDEFRGIAQIDIKKDRTIDQTTQSTRQELFSLKEEISMPANPSEKLKLLVKDYNGKLNYDDYMVEHLSDTEFAYYSNRLFAAGAVLNGSHLSFDGNTYYVFKQNVDRFNKLKSGGSAGLVATPRSAKGSKGSGKQESGDIKQESSGAKGTKEAKPGVPQKVEVKNHFTKKTNEIDVEGKKIPLSQMENKKFLDLFTQTMENNPLDLKKKFTELDEIRKSTIVPLQREFFVRMLKDPKLGDEQISAIGQDVKEYKRKLVFDTLFQDHDFMASFKRHHSEVSKSTEIKIVGGESLSDNQKVCLLALAKTSTENGMDVKQLFAIRDYLDINEFSRQLEENTKLSVKSIRDNLKENGLPEAVVNALRSAGPIGMAFAAVFVLFKVIQKGGWFGLAAISALGIGDAMNGFDLAKSGVSLMSGLMDGGFDKLDNLLSGKKKDEVKESARLSLDKLDESFGYTSFFSLMFGDLNISDLSKKIENGRLSRDGALAMLKEKGIGENDYRYAILVAFNHNSFDKFMTGATQALGLNLSNNNSEQKVFDYVSDHNNIRRQLLQRGLSAKTDRKTEYGQYIQAHKSEPITTIAQGMISAGIVLQGPGTSSGSGSVAPATGGSNALQIGSQPNAPVGAPSTAPQHVEVMGASYPRIIYQNNQYKLIGPDGKEQIFTFGMPSRYDMIQVNDKYKDTQKIKDNLYILQTIFEIWAGVATNKESIKKEVENMFASLNQLEKDIANGIQKDPISDMERFLDKIIRNDNDAALIGGAIGSSDMADIKKVFKGQKSVEDKLIAIFNLMRSSWGTMGSGNSSGVKERLAEELLRDPKHKERFGKVAKLDSDIEKEIMLINTGNKITAENTPIMYKFQQYDKEAIIDMGISKDIVEDILKRYTSATKIDEKKRSECDKANEIREKAGGKRLGLPEFLALGAMMQAGYIMKHAMMKDVVDKMDDRGDENTMIGIYANMVGLGKTSGHDWRIWSDENAGTAADLSLNIATMFPGLGAVSVARWAILGSRLGKGAATLGTRAITSVGGGQRTLSTASWATRSVVEGTAMYQGVVLTSGAFQWSRGNKTGSQILDDMKNWKEIGRSIAIQGAMLGIGRVLNISDPLAKVPFLNKDISKKVRHSFVEGFGMTATSYLYDMPFDLIQGTDNAHWSGGEFAEAIAMSFMFKVNFPAFKGKLRVSRGETGEIIIDPIVREVSDNPLRLGELKEEITTLKSRKEEIIKNQGKKFYKETRNEIKREIGLETSRRISQLESELSTLESRKTEIIANQGKKTYYQAKIEIKKELLELKIKKNMSKEYDEEIKKRINSGNITEIVNKREELINTKKQIEGGLKEKNKELEQIEISKAEIISKKGSLSDEARLQFEDIATDVKLEIKQLELELKSVNQGVVYLDNHVAGSGDNLLRYRYQQEILSNDRYIPMPELNRFFDKTKIKSIYDEIKGLPDGGFKEFKDTVAGKEIGYKITKVKGDTYEITSEGRDPLTFDLYYGVNKRKLGDTIKEYFGKDSLELRRLWSDTNIMEKYVDEIAKKIKELPDGGVWENGAYKIQKIKGNEYVLLVDGRRIEFESKSLGSILKSNLEPHHIYKSFENMAEKTIREVIKPDNEFRLGDDKYRIVQDGTERKIQKWENGKWEKTTDIDAFITKNQHFFMENVVNGIEATTAPIRGKKISEWAPELWKKIKENKVSKFTYERTVGDFVDGCKKVFMTKPASATGFIRDLSSLIATGRTGDSWSKSNKYVYTGRAFLTVASLGLLGNSMLHGDAAEGALDHLMLVGPSAPLAALLWRFEKNGNMGDLIASMEKKFK